jgi:glutaredoxin 3
MTPPPKPPEPSSSLPSATVVCPTHGLRFDPSATSGCIRCAPSTASAPDRARTPLRRSMLWLLVLPALGLAWFGWDWSTRAQTPSAPHFTDQQILAEARRVHVVIYSATWCESCAAAKTFLWQNEVPFEEHDIDKEKDARDHWMTLNPGKTIPVIDVEGDVVVGAAAEPIIRALMRAAERHLAAGGANAEP